VEFQKQGDRGKAVKNGTKSARAPWRGDGNLSRRKRRIEEEEKTSGVRIKLTIYAKEGKGVNPLFKGVERGTGSPKIQIKLFGVKGA